MSMESMEEFSRCLEEIDMSDKIKKSIEDSVKEYNEDENWWFYMTKEEDDIAMRNGEISLAIERGAKENSIKIAKNLLQNGVDIGVISESTGLSIDEIKNINN